MSRWKSFALLALLALPLLWLGLTGRSRVAGQEELASPDAGISPSPLPVTTLALAAAASPFPSQTVPPARATASPTPSPPADPMPRSTRLLPATAQPTPDVPTPDVPTPRVATPNVPTPRVATPNVATPYVPTPNVATPTPSLTPQPDVATGQAVDRSCPDPAPARPDYNHYWLGAAVWPTPAASPSEHFWLAKPLPGGGRFITSAILPYGSDGNGRYLLHNGTDVAEPLGTPVLAVAAGTVVVAGPDDSQLYGWRCDWYGHLVVLELDQRWQGRRLYVLYGHVLGLTVSPGQRVARGEQVAEVGVGGAAVAPHLHLEVRLGQNSFDASRNPLLWVDPGPTRGVIAGRLLDPLGRPWQGYPVQIVGLDPELGNKLAWTYLDDPRHLVHPDEVYGENFVVADLRPGRYQLIASVQGTEVRATAEVLPGRVTVVELVSGPYVTPVPAGDG